MRDALPRIAAAIGGLPRRLLWGNVIGRTARALTEAERSLGTITPKDATRVLSRADGPGHVGAFFTLEGADGERHLGYYRSTCCLLFRSFDGELCHDCTIHPRDRVATELADVELWNFEPRD